MKVLITGANGLLGQKLVSAVKEDESIEALATGRGSSRLTEVNVSYRSLDIENNEEVLQVVGTFKPNVIIHTAAMTNVDACELDHDACWRANVDAVKNMVEAAEKNNCFLLHLSTDFIFKGDAGPYVENSEAEPVNFYGESKLEAERIVKGANIPWAIARTVLVYGITPKMSRSNIILWVKDNLEKQKQIQVVDDQVRSPTLAEDLAQGCLLIAKKKAQGIYHISGKDILTPYEMAIKTADYFNLDKSLIVRTDSTIFKQPAARPLKTGFVIDKAVKELGYNPHSFDEGINLVAKQLSQ